MLNGSFLQKLTANGQIVVKRGWQYDTKYRYVFHLRDAAGNVSDSHTRELHTDVLAVGDADPYLGKDTTTFKPVVMDVNIEYGGDYKLTHYVVPFPHLTFAETSIQKLVSIYGVALAKGHSLEVRVRTKFMTFDRARVRCSAPDSIAFMNASQRECMQRHMGISSIWDWHWQVLKECGYIIPGYTAICIENKKSTKFVSQYKDNLAEKVDHVLIILYNANGQEVGRLWNDDASGRFRFDQALDDGLSVGDRIHAKVAIFGDFQYDGVKVDYRGVDPKSAARNEGLSSVVSNEVVVPEPKDFINSVVSPVGDPSCAGVDITSGYGPRNLNGEGVKMHKGVDLAKSGGCKIQAVYSGQSTRNNGWGTTVKIVHDDFAFATIYGHAAHYIGSTGHVETGDKIMYMGQTGYAFGVHVHFVLRQGCFGDGCEVDPNLFFKKYLEILPSYDKYY
jgi:murein DD-endopeptidase MepM/ murein hydrolase activator NlpD